MSDATRSPEVAGGVWDRFLGHPRVAGVLERAARRPTGTYLFAGSPGTGKRNAARVMAAAIVCPSACGECHACRRALDGLHPDVTILQPEGYTFPVEVLRATVQAAAQSPIEARHRVFIVQEADRIPERSQNALLKALEEPGQSVVWILLASAVQPFLATILSRCQIVDFPPISQEVMLQVLTDRFNLDRERASDLVRLARGDLAAAVRLAGDDDAVAVRALAMRAGVRSQTSVRQALSAADEVHARAKAAREKLEAQQAVELARLLEDSPSQGQGAWRKRLADRNKRALRRAENEVLIDFLWWLGTVFRDLAAMADGAGAGALVSPDLPGEAGRAAAARPARFWVDMVECCLQAQLALRNNANPALVIESTLLRLV